MRFVAMLLGCILPALPVMSQVIDSMTDSRDGQVYTTVVIGTQTWMAENLNVGTRINGTSTPNNNSTIEKFAYSNKDSLANIYGGLYQWDEAMGYSSTEGAQGICPSEWHLPSDAEWKTLEMALGMTQEQADEGSIGRGTDQGTKLKAGGTSGFNALYSGFRYSDGSFSYLGSRTYFWTSTYDYSPSRAWYRYLTSANNGVSRNSNPATLGYCVRCVKNASTGMMGRPAVQPVSNQKSIAAAAMYTLQGRKVEPANARAGVYLMQDAAGQTLRKVMIVR